MVLTNSIFNVKEYSASKARKPNQGSKDPLSAKSKMQNDSQEQPIIKQLGIVDSRSLMPKASYIIMKGMKEKEIKRELFILEEEEEFRNLSDKGKMIYLIKRASSQVKDWYYDLGIEDRLPKDWEVFKNQLILFCCGKDLMSIKKYRDESWVDFINRLKSINQTVKEEEQNIIHKLRSEYAPKMLQVIFYSHNITLDEIIERVEEFENFDRRNVSRIKKGVEIEKNTIKDKTNIICFKCQKSGHYSNECKEEKKIVNFTKSKITSIDKREVLLNNKKFEAIFDTGASNSIITSKILDDIPNHKDYLSNNKFRLINGEDVVVTRAVNLKLKYKNFEAIEKFYIVENNRDKEILISNNEVKRFETKKKGAIECAINTGNNLPVSSYRPIKSYKDKEDFEKLIDELEQDGIIEKSNSLWLNPVQLIRKKMEICDFALIFES